ncbi:MAG: type I pullulanase [Firmicutes bacterium]|nr:type I pullulanase [Bacillota bacterium]
MTKRILSMLLAFALVVGLVGGLPLMAQAKESGAVLKIHYHRDDGSYDGWDVWAWTTSDGSAYAFAEEDGEMVATIPIAAGTTQIGYIIRYGGDSWTSKDVSDDQYVDVTGIVSGTAHLYVEAGVPNSELVLDGAEVGLVVTSAEYDGEDTVTIQLSAALGYDLADDTFVISGTAGTVEASEVRMVSERLYRIVVAEPLTMTKSYTLTFEGEAYSITMPDYYSTEAFEEAYTYTGNDLGQTYSKEQTILRVWAPTAESVTVNLYTDGDPSAQANPVEQVEMTADVNGTWVATLTGDYNGTYYTYLVNFGDYSNEAVDPYARTTGVNGQRGMIIDLDATDPEGWDSDSNPHAGENITDAIIYELHIRDLGSDSSSGIENVGKYLSLTETGTVNSYGISTGLDHIVDLGVTHVHLLPVYDFGSVDESKLDTDQYNWGYDPVNYNVPEGSYSTDPYNGEVRVSEFKQMVLSMHNAGLSVVMDVVYNHVYSADSFCFNLIVPDYFSRPDSSASGCGNDTASERAMVSKYIVDSVCYWADEYHIDGFRFDLVGLLDTDTINEIVEKVHETHPDVIFYGEGWDMSSTKLTKDDVTLATQYASSRTPGFAYFNDTMRDALKGSVFDEATGFVSGASGLEVSIRSSFMANPAWASSPTQVVNYASCHDNNTLYDRIVLSTPNASTEDQIKMNNLAAAIYLTSQGVPFMQAGEEMLRSKPTADGGYDSNSYSSGDAVNSIKWDTLGDEQYMAVYNYYKGLIAFRKAHSILRLTTEEEVLSTVTAVTGVGTNVVAFSLVGEEEMYVVFNANDEAISLSLPEGDWNVYIDGETAGTTALYTLSGEIEVAPISALVMIKAGTEVTEATDSTDAADSTSDSEASANSTGMILGVVAAVVLVVAAVVAIVAVARKKKA